MAAGRAMFSGCLFASRHLVTGKATVDTAQDAGHTHTVGNAGLKRGPSRAFLDDHSAGAACHRGLVVGCRSRCSSPGPAGSVSAEARRGSIAGRAPQTITVLEPPGKDLRPSIGPGRPVLISGRFLTPAGRTALAQSYSWGMAISADESTAVLLSRDAFQVISTAEPKVVDRFPAFGQKAPKWLEDGAYMGCAFSPDSQKLYLGSANHGEIVVYDLKTRTDVDRIDINGNGYEDSFLGDFLLSDDGTFLYGVDQFNYRMVVVDLGRRRVVRSVRVGRNPFGICLSPDGKYAWVSNVGMFEYPLLPGVTPKSGPTAGLSFPAYGVPVEGVRGRRRRRREEDPRARIAQSSRRDVGLQGRTADRSGRGEDQDGLPRRPAAGRYQHRRRRQSQHGGRGQAFRLCLQRHERHHLGHRRPAQRHRGSGRAARAGAGNAARRAALLDRPEPRRTVALRGLRRAERGCGGRSGAAEAGRLHSGRLVLLVGARLTRRQAAVCLQCQGSRLGAQRRARLRGPGPRLASGRHHAGPVPGDRRPRCGPVGRFHAPGRGQHLSEAPADRRRPQSAAAGPAIASQSHPAHRVHRQGEPHLRPGLRGTQERSGRPHAGRAGLSRHGR